MKPVWIVVITVGVIIALFLTYGAGVKQGIKAGAAAAALEGEAE